MKYYEWGKQHNRMILLLPGTCCTIKSNFSQVIPLLSKQFHVIGVDYDGFDGKKTEFSDMLTITLKIEQFILNRWNGKIDIIYGSSLGGSFTALLLQRNQISVRHAIIGSFDFDQDGKFLAWLKTKLILKLMYPILKTGIMPEWMLSIMKKRHSAEELQNSKRMIAAISSGMKHVTKNSVKNQFYSDLITPINKNIQCSGTEIHIFYALQMGEKYRSRYLLHFPKPDIIEQDYGHEELLFFHPEQWITAICDCCQHKLDTAN